jgi:hypothetical protein
MRRSAVTSTDYCGALGQRRVQASGSAPIMFKAGVDALHAARRSSSRRAHMMLAIAFGSASREDTYSSYQKRRVSFECRVR